MTIEIELDGTPRALELDVAGEHLRGSVDGRAIEASAVEVAPGAYSILLHGRSFEVRVESAATHLRVFVNGREFAAKISDPRQWRRDRGAAVETRGRQKLTAPMPGKVVRLLAAVGDVVQAGQGIVVVEAMKMQNEVRSPKSGTVEALLVNEGQTVTAGDTLGYIS